MSATDIKADFLAEYGLPVISHIDTRALVRHLRQHGTKRGVLSTVDFDEPALVAKAKAVPSMVGLDLASRVTTLWRYRWTEPTRDIFTGKQTKGAAGPLSRGRL